MVTARVTRSIAHNSAFIRTIENAGAEKIARELIRVAAAAEAETNSIVAAELVTDRAPDRRRAGARLLGSFRCKIDWNGQSFPIVLRMTSIAPSAKVNAQESGAKAHVIPGPVTFPVAQRWGGKGAQAATPRAAAYGRNKKGSPTVRAPFVNHPGNAAHHMMQRGLEAAVQAAYGQAVRASKR